MKDENIHLKLALLEEILSYYGISARQLAEKLRVTTNTIYRWKNGKRKMSDMETMAVLHLFPSFREHFPFYFRGNLELKPVLPIESRGIALLRAIKEHKATPIKRPTPPVIEQPEKDDKNNPYRIFERMQQKGKVA